MKKNLFTISAALVVLSLFIMQACKKDDTTPPVISLNGSASQTVSLNSSYSDAGATATDDKDGTVNVTSDASSTNPNVNQAGTYTITYHASDASGNQAIASRTVIVRNDAFLLEGTYTTTEGVTSWTQTVTTSATVNKRIIFSKFANYSNNTGIYAMVTGLQVDITTQNGVGIGASSCTHTFTPNGTGAAIPTSGSVTFSIKFTDQEVLGGSGCPATGAVPYEDFFVKQ